MGRLYIPGIFYNGRINNSPNKGVLQVHPFALLPLEERKEQSSVIEHMKFSRKSLFLQSGEWYLCFFCALYLFGVFIHHCGYGSISTLDK